MGKPSLEGLGGETCWTCRGSNHKGQTEDGRWFTDFTVFLCFGMCFMFPSLDFVVAGECLIMFVSCSLIFCAVYFFVSATELHEQLHYAGDPGLA